VEDLIERAQVLIEALPFIQRFRGTTCVIKYGGHAMLADELKQGFAQDVVLLHLVGIKPVVVHGGGPQISDLIKRMGLQSSFVRGLRVTDQATMELVEMALGRINKELVMLLGRHGGRAIGLSGQDGNLLLARKLRMMLHDAQGLASEVDIGLVGEVVAVNPELLRTLQAADFIPVISPVGCDGEGQSYNINADLVAGKLASALKADKLMLMTDVAGIVDRDGQLISTLEASRASALIAQGVISEGMIPKVECCIEALAAGVGKTHIVDGRLLHVLLHEIFTRAGIGTQVVSSATATPSLVNAA